MKKLMFAVFIVIISAMAVSASERIGSEIYFPEGEGYIVEAFIVPEGKSSLSCIKLNRMNVPGTYSVIVADSENPWFPIFMTDMDNPLWYDKGGCITIDLSQTPVSPGMKIHVFVCYSSVDDEKMPFSVPASAGGIEIGHADSFLIIANPVEEIGYTAFTLEYDQPYKNNPPMFTKGPEQVVNMDSGSHKISGWASDISAGDCETDQNAMLRFQVTTNNDALFVSERVLIDPADGSLYYNVEPGVSGTAEATAVLIDSGGTENGGSDTSASQTFSITVKIIPGDVDGENEVTLADAILALQVIAGIKPEKVCIRADVNNDEKLGPEEAVYILQKLSTLRKTP